MTERSIRLALAGLIVVCGAFFAVHFANVATAPGETGKAAIALITKGYLGDPYMLPTGPTAHVSPLVGAYLAAVFKIFGTNNTNARVALGLIAAGFFAFAADRSVRLASLMGGRNAVLATVATIVIGASAFLFFDVVASRQWDEPFAAAILTQAWLTFERARQAGDAKLSFFCLGALSGIAILVSPAVAVAVFAALLLLAWEKREATQTRQSAIIALVICGIIVLPWVVRNYADFHKFIPTRSNFGLELAIGNGPNATGYSEVSTTLHPHDSLSAAREVQRIGEIAYMQKMETLALSDIRNDPVRFASLTALRIAGAFVPHVGPADWVPGIGVKGALLVLVVFGLAKICALVFLAAASARYLSYLVFALLPMAPYFITHVNIRYEIPTFFTFAVLFGIAVHHALSETRSSSSS